MDDLKSKAVIVTGASSGIGLATATAPLAAGAHVLGVDISPCPPTLSSFPKSHFAFHQCNLTHPESPALVVKAALDAFNGRIDVLLNVAGIGDTFGSVDTLTDEKWDRIITTNLTAPVKLMREVVPETRKNGGGSIVNVASKGGASGASTGVAYTASKHGLVGATKNVARRFKDERIRCNAICPGGVKTNIRQSVTEDLDMDAIAVMKVKPIHEAHVNQNPGFNQPASPESIANLLLFLSSDMSQEISGAIIPIDHAWSTI